MGVDVSSTFQLAGAGFMVVVAVGMLIGVQVSAARRRRPQKIEGLHGTARWITTAEELREIGFLPKSDADTGSGVYIGAWTDPKTQITHYLRHDGPEHIGAIAPTRSGKGVGLVLPTLLSYPHSCVVNDMKGELWGQTAGWRKEHAGNVVIKFDPAAAEGSGRFNPLNEIRIDSINAVGDTQNLVTMIVDPDGQGPQRSLGQDLPCTPDRPGPAHPAQEVGGARPGRADRGSHALHRRILSFRSDARREVAV